ncbi:BTB domain-containing protein [Favolaschia claudopus]|uniref:BTB domain-containing protein n=1 Tax=Favolaschia claudopus TaxID=2862362 RepID=A0AAW0DJI5_9AGAR
MADAAIAADLVREESLWFSDGTLVLQAGNYLFRLSPGILSAKSIVFQDMLAFPQPGDGPMYDGCPLVHLPDPGQDAMYFLKAIFHYDFFESWPADVDYSVMSGILRLSHKYQVEPLRKRALIHLSKRFPTCLEEFGCVDEWSVDPTLIVNLAREVNADWVLVIALYSCASLQLPQLFDSCLAPGDLLTVLQARDQLQTHWTTAILDFLWEPLQISKCISPSACLNGRLNARKKAELSRSDHVITLCLWNDDDWYELDGVCNACLNHMKKTHRERQEECWDALPALFNLPAWNILLLSRFKSLGNIPREVYCAFLFCFT